MPCLSRSRLLALTSLLPLALAGCNAGRAGYPSLAERPAERAFAQSTRAAPAPAAPGKPDPATLHEIAALRDDAERSAESFAHEAQDTERLTAAARSSAVGSEAWAAATVAMASLDSARSDTARTLADLDALKVKTAVAAADTDDPDKQATYVAVTAADDAVAAILDRQDSQIAALHKTIGS